MPTNRADWKTATIPDSVISADQQGKAIDALIKGIADDDDAVSAAGQGAFNYSQRWADKEAKHELADEPGQSDAERNREAQIGMHDAYYGARLASEHIDLVANKENAARKVDAANNRAQASAAFSALSSFGGPYLAPVGKVGSIGATLAGVSDYFTVVDSGVEPSHYEASIIQTAARNGLIDDSVIPASSWWDPDTRTVSISDSQSRSDFQQ